MTRSPLFYPMHRGDTEAGGAADLQTDIMRFMAILALCLVAIFALVQSIPLIPEAPATSTATAAPPPEPVEESPLTRPPEPAPQTENEAQETVALTRPKWQSVFVTRQRSQPPAVASPSQNAEERTPIEAADRPIAPPTRPTQPSESTKGWSLRFESDQALTRLVAAGKVGLYAIDGGRAQRMTVSESRISFWEASTPQAFHEMEVSTVPGPVVDALARTGSASAGVDWGVTLPGKLSQQLSTLMQANDGGELVIGIDGELRLETS